jgi:hypothetical protein
LYIPSTSLQVENLKETSWQVGNSMFVSLVTRIPTKEDGDNDNDDDDNDVLELLGLGGVSHLLATSMGLPSAHNNPNARLAVNSVDGSLPRWHVNWWWHTLQRELEIRALAALQLAHNVLVDKPTAPLAARQALNNALAMLEQARNETISERIVELLEQSLELARSIPQQVPLEQKFPLEHYAAIFAPLLFPLLLPFLTQLARERKRYLEKVAAAADKKNTKTEKVD